MEEEVRKWGREETDGIRDKLSEKGEIERERGR